MSLLPAGYRLEPVDRFPDDLFETWAQTLLFDQATHIPLREWEQEALEAQGLALPYPMPDRLRLGIFHGDAWAGFTVGWRQRTHAFYMGMSGVMADHRRKGLYRALVLATLEHAKARGYAEVWSRHLPTNTAVLVAKLNMGFIPTGMEVDAEMGTLLTLRHPLTPERNAALRTRLGCQRATERLWEHLGPKTHP